MEVAIIGCASDLGVHIDGAYLGSLQLINDVKGFFEGEVSVVKQNENIIKSRNLSDRKKNKYDVDKINAEIYKEVLAKKDKFFTISIGGDSSISIPSALATSKKNEKIGMIVISAHPSYNTFESTVSGNINGLSNAAINGYKCEELRDFYDGDIIQASKSVLVGVRSIDQWEKDNIKYSNVNIIEQKELLEKGIEQSINEAFEMALTKTKCVHVIFNMDIFDPDIAPGVSVPSIDGLTVEQGMEIFDELLKHIDNIEGFDLVEFNSLRDVNRKTEQIAVNILSKLIRKVEKDKNVTYYK
ncbi:MAG: arginase family protein [Bacilli bacterium]|nr:arginase family protein [Bacilli bacterium]